MKKKVVYFLLVFFLLQACSSKEKDLSKVWFFISTTREKTTADFVSKGFLPENLNSLSFLNLEQGGKYTACFSSFEEGKWMLKDGTQLILENDKKEVKVLQVQTIEDNKLVFLNDKAEYEFEGYPNTFSSPAESPFSKVNNQWRIKPRHKETEKEITDRLKNHFSFWEKYFTWGIQIEKKTLNVRSVPGPLKMYGNGFALQPFEDIAEGWRENFYDTADARIAFTKLHLFMVREDIDWPNTDHKFKGFQSAFRQLQQRIK